MDIIKVVKGVHYMRDMETGIIWFNAAEMARKLGIVDKKTGKRAGTEFIKWDRFNKYAKSVTINQNDFVDTCVDNLIINCGTRGSVTISYPIKNGDYVPYRLVLLIAMKVNNDVAREFQYELTNIVDEIINSGIKTNSELINMGTEAIQKDTIDEENFRTNLNNAMIMYAKQNNISVAQAYNKFYHYFDMENNMRVNVRANNYAKKNNIKNYSTPKYMKDQGMINNAGNAIHNMAYDSYNLSKYGVPNNYITPIPQVNVSVSLPNTNQQDDGYYHPALKPVVSVTAVINGKKKTSTTFIDKDGNTFFQNREE